MKSKIVVYGIYPSRVAVESAVEELKMAGFSVPDISVLLSSPHSTKEFAHENSTKAPEGATSGGITGATIGGVLGWLAGIGSLAIPGVGPLIAAGPIMATLTGIGVGSIVGGLSGALVGAGIPEYEAKRFEGKIKNGGILLSVHAENKDWAKRAKEILTRTGADDISTQDEESSDMPEERSRTTRDPRASV